MIAETVWVIMSKDRKVIAKGTPRNRWLIPIDCKVDRKRIITYSSQKMAEAGFKGCWFYSVKESSMYKPEDMEAVEATLHIN